MYTTSTAAIGGKQRTGETIMTQGKGYIRGNGKWMDSRVTTAEVLQQEKENEKNGRATCQLVRSQAVNSEAAMIYFLHREAQGLQRRFPDLDLEVDRDAIARRARCGHGGEIGKRHNSEHFEYGKAQAPM